MHGFRVAIEAGDIDAAMALMAENVEFRSPVVFKPYRGHAALRAILTAVAEVLDDFSYTREIGAPGARDSALVFRARVGDKAVEGCDFLHLDDDGLISEFVVMVRPMSGIHALAEAMGRLLAATQPKVAAGS